MYVDCFIRAYKNKANVWEDLPILGLTLHLNLAGQLSVFCSNLLQCCYLYFNLVNQTTVFLFIWTFPIQILRKKWSGSRDQLCLAFCYAHFTFLLFYSKIGQGCAYFARKITGIMHGRQSKEHSAGIIGANSLQSLCLKRNTPIQNGKRQDSSSQN